jgi:predicted S18 family serine protease
MPRLLHQFSLLIGSLMLLLITACATTAPVQEMSNARQTIQAAVEAGAEIHAPDELANARELLDDASRELEVGNYPLARDYALQAKQQAMQARQTALLKTRQKE